MFSSSKKKEADKEPQSNSNQKRLEDLNRAVQGLSSAQKEDRNARREFFIQKIRQMEDKIQKNQISDNQKFKLLYEQIEKSEEVMQQEAEQRDLIGEKSLKQLTLIEKNFTLQLNEEYQTRRGHEQEIFQEIDDKISQMKVEVKKDSQENRRYEISQIEGIEKEIEDLRFFFEKEKHQRDQNTEHLIRSFGEEILRLQEFFSEDKRVSEDNYENTIKLLQDLDFTIQNDLENEKIIRERSERSMLKLLEETCQKIEQSLLND